MKANGEHNSLDPVNYNFCWRAKSYLGSTSYCSFSQGVALLPVGLKSVYNAVSLKAGISSYQELISVQGLRTGCLEILLENRNYGYKHEQNLYGPGKAPS